MNRKTENDNSENQIQKGTVSFKTNIEINITQEDLLKDLVERTEGSMIIPDDQQKEKLN
ncbi:hypothetical protein D3C85_1715560 [compost metagenome]